MKRLRERKDELGYTRRDKENSVRKLGSLPAGEWRLGAWPPRWH